MPHGKPERLADAVVGSIAAQAAIEITRSMLIGGVADW
jgi:hypothetical protein